MITEIFAAMYDFFELNIYHHGPAFVIPFVLLAIIGVAGQWSLYDKAGLPGIAAIVPGWNVTTFLKIMGRPSWHAIYLLIPGFNIYFVIKLYVELCQTFGKRTILDYVLCLVFNGFYVMFLGLSSEDKYVGPVYGSPDGMPIPLKDRKTKKRRAHATPTHVPSSLAA